MLLDAYGSGGSEAAFRELTDRHLPLVLATARRMVPGGEAARDIAQIVFIHLARRSSRIPRLCPLAARLHRETRSVAIDYIRSETRRAKRENISCEMKTIHDSDIDWGRIAPCIDEAVDSLSETDRSSVLLRFYENRGYSEIAREFGISEDAARMSTNRALERLRDILNRKGIATTMSALAATLPQPCPCMRCRQSRRPPPPASRRPPSLRLEPPLPNQHSSPPSSP